MAGQFFCIWVLFKYSANSTNLVLTEQNMMGIRTNIPLPLRLYNFQIWFNCIFILELSQLPSSAQHSRTGHLLPKL